MVKGTAALILFLGLFSSGNARSQTADDLPDYVPLLPAVKAKAFAVDPQKGYLVKELKPGIFMITDGRTNPHLRLQERGSSCLTPLRCSRNTS